MLALERGLADDRRAGCRTGRGTPRLPSLRTSMPWPPRVIIPCRTSGRTCPCGSKTTMASIGRLGVVAMLDVDQPRLVDRHAVRLAPHDVARQLTPSMRDDLVLMGAGSQNGRLAPRLVGRLQNRRPDRGGHGRGAGRLQKVTTRRIGRALAAGIVGRHGNCLAGGMFGMTFAG